MKGKSFYVIVFISFLVLSLSFGFSIRYLRSSVDHVVFEDIKTLREVLVSSLRTSIKTQKEQEFYVVRNLLKAEEWLSRYPDFSVQNLRWLKEVTEISGILILSENLRVLSIYPEYAREDSILDGFNPKEVNWGDVFPYENEYSINLASRVTGKIAVFFVIREELFEKRIAAGTNELLSSLERDRKIAFLVLQDTQGIWFGVKVPDEVEDIEVDKELMHVFSNKKSVSRVTNLGGEDVLEIAMPFEIEGIFNGIIRLGISRDYYAMTYRGFVRNLLLIHLLLFVLIVVVLSFVFSRKNVQIKMLSFDSLMNHIKLGIALFDRQDRLVYANDDFYKLLRVSKKNASKMELHDIMPDIPVLEVSVRKDLMKKRRLTAVPILSKGERRAATLVIVEDTEIEERLERAERIELLGGMSAQVAHEIKNPLNSISMIIQRLNSEFVITPEMESRELISIVIREIERIKETVNRFVSIMAPMNVKWECTDLCAAIEEVLAQFFIEFKAKEINFRTLYKACPKVMMDREKFKESLKNVLRNSLEAQEAGGEIRLAVILRDELVKIIVGDRGKGMAREELLKVGSPFYTTKPTGSGLGLFYVRKVMEAHGGEVIIKSKKGAGTVVVLSLSYAKDRRC